MCRIADQEGRVTNGFDAYKEIHREKYKLAEMLDECHVTAGEMKTYPDEPMGIPGESESEIGKCLRTDAPSP